MKQIPLKNKKGEIVGYAKVDDEDYDSVSEYKWYINKSGNIFYAQSSKRVNGVYKSILLHKLILDKPRVDHINHDGLDCQRSNIRECSPRQNSMNTRKRKGCNSDYKGVTIRGDKWRARISVSGKRILLGYFICEIDAAIAYDNAAKKYFGDFACLNFPKTKEAIF